MTINRALPLMVFLMLAATPALSACGGAAPQAGERQPSHPTLAPLPQFLAQSLPPRASPATAAAPATPQAAPDWRDMPLPAGNWVWSARATGSEARFGVAGQPPIAHLQCDRASGVVRIVLPVDRALAMAARPATITTSTSSGTVIAEPLTIDGLPGQAITLPVNSRLLDAMAFSRGRFRVEMTGIAPVVLPSWSEVGRVVEDCRG